MGISGLTQTTKSESATTISSTLLFFAAVVMLALATPHALAADGNGLSSPLIRMDSQYRFVVLQQLGPAAKQPMPVERKSRQKTRQKLEVTEKLTDRLRFVAADFTAQLPWFYHGRGFDTWQSHDVYSFEANSLTLQAGDYTVAVVPKDSLNKIAVSYDGLKFHDIPVHRGRAELRKIGIRNRMLSFYVKWPGSHDSGPLKSVVAYPSRVTFTEAEISALPFTRHKRNIRSDEREILQKESWPEFYEVLGRPGFGGKQLRGMFNRIVEWCKRRQVLDPKDIHYGAIYSEEDKYDFRDAAAAAVCFTYAWRDTGNNDYHRRALLARNYVYKGQHMNNPNDTQRYGGFCHMVHGVWARNGMQRLPSNGKLGSVVGVETAIVINLLVKTFEHGLKPAPKDIKHLRAAATWMFNSEFSHGVFRHHQGATNDCQASNAMGVAALIRAYYALEKLGEHPPRSWLVAAQRGMSHYLEGQEAVGCWPYTFATIGRGQAYREQNIPDQGMGFYHCLVACDSPTFRQHSETKDAMKRAARWWLCMSRIDRNGPMKTIDLDDRRASGNLKFSKFTWCRFMAAASLMQIARLTDEKQPWQQLALRYMEHIDTKLRNTTDPNQAPYKRATTDDMTLCSWIQAAEWAGVLLREMEEQLPKDTAP